MNKSIPFFSMSILALSINSAIAGQTDLVSVFNAQSSNQSVSDVDVNTNGSFVVFDSKATNLDGATGGFAQIFIKNMSTEAVRMVSRNNDGSYANASVRKPAISGDGNRVVFETNASNMGSGNSNNNIYVRDLTTGSTILVSSNAAGVPGNGSSRNPRISEDGRFVVFDSTATNLVDNDSNTKTDIFIKELDSGNIWRISKNSTGEQLDGNSLFPDISSDGRYTVFVSLASNIAPAVDTNGRYDVYIHDRVTGQTELVSKNSLGEVGNSTSTLPRISGNGQFVAFSSVATNLNSSGGDSNSRTDIFVHDRITGSTILASKRNNGTQSSQLSFNARISNNGRYIAFINSDGNILDGDNNNGNDMFVYDRVSDTLIAASLDQNGQFGTGSVSNNSALSGDGSAAVFISNTPDFDGSSRDKDNLNDAYMRIISVPNSKPIANAGLNQTLECQTGGATFILNATNSYDLDGDQLTYKWTGPFGEITGQTVEVQLEYGQHNVLLTVTDSLGETATDTLILEVTDSINPSVSAGGDQLVEATSIDGASHALNISATDSCSTVSTLVTPGMDKYPLGTTEVTVTGSDLAGNVASDVARITVADTTPPVVTPPTDIIAEANAVNTLVDAGIASAQDIFPVVSITNDGSGSFPLGNNIITWQATDSNGNTGTAIQSVNIVDTTPPVIRAPADITLEASSETMAVEFGQASASDLFLKEITHDAPALFPLGHTVITWTATDTSGNTASAQQNIVLQDTIAPELTINGELIAEAISREGAPYNFSYDVSDSCNCGTPVVTIAPMLSSYPLGDTQVILTATDNSGNTTSKQVTLSIVDTTAPELQLPPSLTVEATAKQTPVEIGKATATDIFDFSIEHNAPALFPVGITNVEWVATDINGNISRGIQQISVKDTIAPDVQPLSDITTEATGKLTPVSLPAPEATDIFGLTYHNDAPTDGFPLGDTLITWTVTDTSGNKSTTTQLIHVVDTTPPVIDAGADVTLEAVRREGSPYSFSYKVTDSSQSGPIDVTAAPVYSFYPLGVTPVTLTARDISGNQASDILNITVVDTTAPLVTAPPDITVEATGAYTATDIGVATASDIFDFSISHNATGSYKVGQTLVTWQAKDINGNIGTATQHVTVTDTTAPAFELNVLKDEISGPRFRMVHAATVRGLSDLADEAPNLDIQVTSNADIEGKGRFKRGEDWKIVEKAGEWHIYLRAENLFRHKGEDRIYNIDVTATDASGNTASEHAEVTVSRKAGKRSHRHDHDQKHSKKHKERSKHAKKHHKHEDRKKG